MVWKCSLPQVLRELFSYKPPLTQSQFFANGFAERKVIMCTEILSRMRDWHKQHGDKSSKTKPSSASSKMGPRVRTFILSAINSLYPGWSYEKYKRCHFLYDFPEWNWLSFDCELWWIMISLPISMKLPSGDCRRTSLVWVNICSGNDLVLPGSNWLPESMFKVLWSFKLYSRPQWVDAKDIIPDSVCLELCLVLLVWLIL